MRAAIYLRQSKDLLGTGLAVERQREDCERLAAERGWTVTATYIDNDSSASSGKRRPGYEELLDLIDSGGVDVVVAWHIDRLMRRLADLESLIVRCQKVSVQVKTVSGDVDLSTDQGRLIGRILSSVAQGEVERKSARQKRATLQAAQAGEVPTRRAFGYLLSGEPDPVEAPALRELYRHVLAGMSLLGATRWLNDTGHMSTRGKPWDPPSVRKMLCNPRNAGFRTHLGTIVGPGKWTPIVDEPTWRATVETFAGRRTPGYGTALRWLGSGLFYCHCGSRIRIGYNRAGVRLYSCRARPHLGRVADPIDETVETVIVDRLRQGDLADLLAGEAPDVTPLRDEAASLRLRLDQLGTDYAEGLLTGRQVQLATERFTGKLAAVEGKLASAGRGSSLAPLLNASDPGQAWLELDLQPRRAVLDALATVTILSGRAGGAPFDPESVRIAWKGAEA